MRSHAELLEASGYSNRPKDFDDLIRILDSEIRLITPTDPEGKNADDDSVTQTKPGQKYFQLTHDYRAVKYCNWLSEQEGLPAAQWCHEIMGDEIKLKVNYLSLGGYRLPTEAEMEYATRAGTLTKRFFGETDHMLPMYAWFTRNSQEETWPVGSLKPNDFGLFDVHGNMFTWCQERLGEYPQGDAVSDDKEDQPGVDGNARRVLRGGSFLNQALHIRSAFRLNFLPSNRLSSSGFRLARTLPRVPLTPLPPTAEGDRNQKKVQ